MFKEVTVNYKVELRFQVSETTDGRVVRKLVSRGIYVMIRLLGALANKYSLVISTGEKQVIDDINEDAWSV
jgi:hypothetical protein